MKTGGRWKQQKQSNINTMILTSMQDVKGVSYSHPQHKRKKNPFPSIYSECTGFTSSFFSASVRLSP